MRTTPTPLHRPRPRGRSARAAVLASASAVSLALAAASPAAGAAATEPQAVADPGFETGTGWTASGNAASWSLKADGSRSGSQNGSFWSASPYDASVSTELTALTPGWHTVRVWVRSGSATPGESVGATTVSTSGCGVDGTVAAPSTEADDAWVQVVVSLDYDRGADCRLVLRTQGPHGGEWARFDDVTVTDGQAERLVRGADTSGVEKNEAVGAVYRSTDGTVSDPYTLLSDAGVNLARLKVWVDPADGYNTTQHVVAAALRAQAAGMKVMIDFHYSNTWADPGKQRVPSAWASDAPDGLATDVTEHTTSVLSALKEAGVDVAYVQVGNEINSGMLLPYGQTWDVDPTDGVHGAQWDALASYLKAGIDATQAVYPGARTILHLTNVNNGLGGLTWWYDEVMSRGVDPDVLGLSFYGYWHGSLADLQAAATGLVDRYGKDVMVVETAYPFTLADDDPAYPNIVASTDQLVAGYPASPEGQAQWIHDLGTVVEALPGGHGLGVVAWEPAWTARAGNGWDETDPTSGNAWENQAVFDFQDRLLPTASYAFADDVRIESPSVEPSAPATPEPSGTPSSTPSVDTSGAPTAETSPAQPTASSSVPSSLTTITTAAPSGSATTSTTLTASTTGSLARTGANTLATAALGSVLLGGAFLLRRRGRA